MVKVSKNVLYPLICFSLTVSRIRLIKMIDLFTQIIKKLMKILMIDWCVAKNIWQNSFFPTLLWEMKPVKLLVNEINLDEHSELQIKKWTLTNGAVTMAFNWYLTTMYLLKSTKACHRCRGSFNNKNASNSYDLSFVRNCFKMYKFTILLSVVPAVSLIQNY